jgi:hypothetical protein
MSGLGNNLPPRDPSGRFVKRPLPSPPPRSAERPLPSPPPRSAGPLETVSVLAPTPRPPPPRFISPPSDAEPRTPSPRDDDKAPLYAPDFRNPGSASPGSSAGSNFQPAPSSRHPSPPSSPSVRHVYSLRPLTPTPQKAAHTIHHMSQPAAQHHHAGAGPAAMLPPYHQVGAGPAAVLPPRHQVGAGPAAMPPPRSSRAPLFTGTVGDSIQDFVVEYEEYADSCGLTDRQKTETIIRYLSREIRDFWKSHNNYLTGNWRELKRELLTFYNGSSSRKRYSEEKLREFARRTSKLRMRNENEVNHYYWQFMLLSKPLLDSHRLTTEAHNKIFWRGFHKKDRAAMTPRLIARHPDLDGDEYFDYQDVYRIARRTFSRTRGSDSDDSADESHGARGKRSDRGYDQEEHDSRETDSTR